MSEKATSLYRYFDDLGRLLYVGITARSSTRLLQHAAQSDWWPLVRRSTIEHFPNRASAIATELRVIREESPLYNIVGQESPRRAPARGTGLGPRESGRIGGLTAWSRNDPETMVGPANRGFRMRFDNLVDPDRRLTSQERAIRSDRAMRAHMLALAAKSAAVRSARKVARRQETPG